MNQEHRLKLQQLKYLLAIADNDLSITAAANQLYTSQPGVSRQLGLLEAELGTPIFTRNGRKLASITHAGRHVIAHARVIMHEVEAIRKIAQDCRRTPGSTSRVASGQ
jgi:LysR family transcriptional regulator, cys regulon transcriptional activator